MTDIETTDIFRGAFYLCMGSSLTDIRFDSADRQIATFFFNGKNLHLHDTAYASGRAQVNPVQLRTALNYLRDILFEKLREQNPRMRIGRYENDRKGAHRAYQEHL